MYNFVCSVLLFFRVTWVVSILILDRFVKSPQCLLILIPAKAGIQSFQARMDSCFRRNDSVFDSRRSHPTSNLVENLMKSNQLFMKFIFRSNWPFRRPEAALKPDTRRLRAKPKLFRAKAGYLFSRLQASIGDSFALNAPV